MTSPELNKFIQWDREYIWHPFTQHSIYDKESPLIIDRGEGIYLIDIYGNKYIDAVSSIWCAILGHRHPRLDKAIKEQIDKIAHSTLLGNSNTTPIKLAKKLIDLAPKQLRKIFFSDNGSTAIEIAIKISFQYWQIKGKKKNLFVSLNNAYHGDTIGSVSVGGINTFHRRFKPLLFKAIHLPTPQYREDNYSIHIEQFKEILQYHKEEIAALIIEPGFQGAAGIVTYPKNFLKTIVELAKEEEILIIYDEVASGIGRGGYLFASQRENIDKYADFICLAKGLSGGYLPLAATLTTNEVFEKFLGKPSQERTFYHGHTFTGNALGSAVALEVLEIVSQQAFLDSVKKKEKVLSKLLKNFEKIAIVKDVRQWGLAAGIELADYKNGLKPFDPDRRVGMKISNLALKYGVFTRPLGDTLVIMPPLIITDEQLAKVTEALEKAIDIWISKQSS